MFEYFSPPHGKGAAGDEKRPHKKQKSFLTTFNQKLMSTSTAPRAELLSKRGKKLLQRAFSGERLQNEFSVLCMDDDEDESSSVEENATPVEAINQARMSPRFSPRMSPRLHGYHSSPSPRWTKITPRKRMPKFDLNDTAAAAPSLPAASSSFYEEDVGDLSNLAALTVDSKGRRSKHRKQYGNKPNQFKAREQRLYSQSKREEQRQASKAANASQRPGNDDDDFSYDSD